MVKIRLKPLKRDPDLKIVYKIKIKKIPSVYYNKLIKQINGGYL